jgi:HSP20 family protein
MLIFILEEQAMITRWPLADVQLEMSRLQNEMNRLFSRQGNGNPSPSRPYPAINLWEDGDRFMVEAELPGMELDDIEIFVDGGNQLTIKGERKALAQDNGTWHRQERGFGQFVRTVTLSANVDTERVEAKLKNGVLTISLPKPDEVKPRKITVKAQ